MIAELPSLGLNPATLKVRRQTDVWRAKPPSRSTSEPSRLMPEGPPLLGNATADNVTGERSATERLEQR